MSGLEPWIIPLTVIIAIIGLAAVIVLAFKPRRPATPTQDDAEPKPRKAGVGAAELTCTVCHRDLIISPDELVALSPVEMALVVRGRPKLVGRALREYVCPYCEAAHCFVVEGGHLGWIAANLYEPQSHGAHCMECGDLLEVPPWPQALYDGRLTEAPEMRPNFGLRCPRCDSVCCVSCSERATRGRTTTPGENMCPRCGRPPMNQVYHG